MSQLDGTTALLRLALRRDRIVVPSCIGGVALLFVSTVASFAQLYPTVAERLRFARTITGNAAFTALYGPARGLETTGGLTTWRLATTAATIVALIALLVTIRHTRAEEERGQTELVLGAAVGRRAPLSSTALLVLGMLVAIAVLVALVPIVAGEAAGGSVALGAGLLGAGAVFAGVGAVCAQLTSSARAARAIGGALLAAVYAVRAAADAGGAGWLRWLSPIGWSEELRPFAGEQWWALLPSLAATLLAFALAAALLARRDLGSGLLPARPGPARATDRLRSADGLALRLQRASILGWCGGLLLGGLAVGAVGNGAADLLETNASLEDLFSRGGRGALTDQFFASVLVLLAFAAAAAAIASVLRLRGEETSGRAEPVLAGAVGRIHWAGGHLRLAFALGTLALLSVGLGIGVAMTIATGDAAELWRLTGAALAQAPAVWVLAGVAVLLTGALPRAVPVAWAALTVCVLLWFLGPLVRPPGWILDLSPFTHVPAAPAEHVTAVPLLALTAIAAGLTGAGLVALRRRDLQA